MVGPRNAQFAEESAEVEVLFAQTKKHEEIGKKIKAALTRIQESGGTLREAVAPVYNDTQRLQIMERSTIFVGNLALTVADVSRVLVAIDKLRRPLEGKADEERTIHDGPERVGLQGYLASLHRVEKQLSSLKATNLRVNQDAAGELSGLLSHGSSQLQVMFEHILRDHTKKVEPLHYITKQIPFPVIPDEKAAELASLASFIAANGPPSSQSQSQAVRIYADIRGTYLASSLENLASASISTSRKKNNDEMYRQGTSGIGTYASGIEGSFVSEWTNITAIFPREYRSTAFELATRKSMGDFARTLRELNSQIKSSITTDCFLAYEIVDIVSRLASRLDEQTRQLKPQFLEAVKPVRDTAKLSLPELLEDVRRRIGGIAFFPADGAAIQYTAEVMTRLQSLVGYPKALASIMTSIGDGNWTTTSSTFASSSTSLPSTKSFDVGADGSKLIAHYAQDMIETLLSNLEAKARGVLKIKATLGVFMANNVAVVDRMIRSSELQTLFSATNSSNKVETWRKKSTAQYLDAWREPCAALMDVQYTNRGARPPSGNTGTIDSAAVLKGLTNKDKDAIKEKFKTFNILFENLTARHREMATSMEREVKSQLAREVSAMLEPLYARFWDRYHDIDKGKGKYVRFDKGSLSASLASLG